MVAAALAVLAGNALVQAMVTDGWEGVRHKVASLFGRGTPDPRIEQRLDTSRAELEAAPPPEADQVRSALAAQWQTRFADLLTDFPDTEPELAALVTQITTSDHSVTAGGDVKVSADRGGLAAVVIHGNVNVGPTKPGSATR
jgi:hypothetical protein